MLFTINQVYTVSEVAALRGVTPSHVRLMLKRGFWDSYEARKSPDGVWLICNPMKSKPS